MVHWLRNYSHNVTTSRTTISTSNICIPFQRHFAHLKAVLLFNLKWSNSSQIKAEQSRKSSRNCYFNLHKTHPTMTVSSAFFFLMQSLHTVSCAGPPSFGRGSPKVLAHQLPCKLSPCVEMLLNPFVVTTVVVVVTSHSHRLLYLCTQRILLARDRTNTKGRKSHHNRATVAFPWLGLRVCDPFF